VIGLGELESRMNATTTARSSVWAFAGGGPGRTGLAAHTGDIGTRPARTLRAGAGVQASVVFDAGHRALVADMGGMVRAFDGDGRRLWQQQLDGPVSATPAVDLENGRLFVGTHAGWIYGLKSADGAVLWRSRLPSAGDPRIVADLLYLSNPERVVASSWGGQFQALAAASGGSLHTWNAGISPQSAASADARNNIYCLRAVWDEGVSLVRVAPDGRETVLHRSPEGERRANRAVVAAAPVIDDGRGLLYFIANGDRVGRVHAWDLATDRLQWSVEFERAIVATPALRPDGSLMIADMTGALSTVDSGSIRFRYYTGCEYLLAGPVSNGSSVTYLGDPAGWFHRVDSNGTGKPLFEAHRSLQARPSWSSAGDLYLPAMDGRIHVFGHAGSP